MSVIKNDDFLLRNEMRLAMYEFSDNQKQIIRATIENMLNQGREHYVALDQVCDPDYLKGREKYPISALVYSGFDTEQQIIPGFTVQKIQYGKGRFMPELYNREAVIQLYSDTSDPFGTKEVKSKIEAWGERFQIIQFTITKDTYQLEKLVQITFDGFTEKGRAKVQAQIEL